MTRQVIQLSGGRSYPIDVISGGLDGLGEAVAGALKPPFKVHLVTNPVVGALYLDSAPCRDQGHAGRLQLSPVVE